MPARTATLLAGLALGLAGCTGGSADGDFEGEEAAVAEAIAEFEASATRQENAAEICRDSLSRELAERLDADGTRCATEIRQAIADADLYDIEVVDVEVDGTNATAQARTSVGDQTTSATLMLVEEQGDWRVDGIRDTGG